MKFMKWLVILCICGCSAYAVNIKKEGLIPTYRPYEIGVISLFIPYNPTIIVVGDRVADFASTFAREKDCANVYGFTADADDFEKLRYSASQLPNLKPHFGLLNHLENGYQIFYSALIHDIPYEPYYHFSGSLLEPLDAKRTFLFGRSYQVPTYNFSLFCKAQNISKIHVIHLDCGGNELKILKSIQSYLKENIVVFLKTYHQEIRKEIGQFQQVHQFMTGQGYELFSHYIYDDVIGDALYVKSKYVSAIFRSKEL
jgi:hypothetical protein